MVVAGLAAFFFMAGRRDVAGAGRCTDAATAALPDAADGAAGAGAGAAGAAGAGAGAAGAGLPDGAGGIGTLGRAGCWAAQPSSSRWYA
ncbi:hypothetical protein GCM10010425_68570 [Streptomyces spororaveus]|uniref:Uncharacterized protein n=1 Tax=Streptomyces spororaveus TaxID=284039 RepID=A0ABQ3T321_9ACTN|nr:hypothetical protein Sspor_03520 [Streptomyces spororaveus]